MCTFSAFEESVDLFEKHSTHDMFEMMSELPAAADTFLAFYRTKAQN
jgi:hypothetical protein